MLDTISMAAQLRGEYKTVFEKADMYGALENSGDESNNDDKMMNLYDILMQAQEDNVPEVLYSPHLKHQKTLFWYNLICPNPNEEYTNVLWYPIPESLSVL